MEEGERDPTLGGELLTVDGCLGRKSHDFWWTAQASVVGPIPVHTEATLTELCVFISKNKIKWRSYFTLVRALPVTDSLCLVRYS